MTPLVLIITLSFVFVSVFVSLVGSLFVGSFVRLFVSLFVSLLQFGKTCHGIMSKILSDCKKLLVSYVLQSKIIKFAQIVAQMLPKQIFNFLSGGLIEAQSARWIVNTFEGPIFVIFNFWPQYRGPLIFVFAASIAFLYFILRSLIERRLSKVKALKSVNNKFANIPPMRVIQFMTNMRWLIVSKLSKDIVYHSSVVLCLYDSPIELSEDQIRDIQRALLSIRLFSSFYSAVRSCCGL